MNAPQKTTIATAIDALTPEQHAAAKQAGAAWARKDNLAVETLTNYARMLGDQVTRLQYETAAADWKEGWIGANPGKTSAAVDKAWQRFKNDLEDMFEIEILKPASDSPLAQQRAAERAQKKADLIAAYQASSPDQIRQAIEKNYSALAKNPTSKDLKKTVKDLETVLKEKTSEENKAHGEEIRAARSQVKEAANKCTDLETLAAALDILTGAADYAYNGPANQELHASDQEELQRAKPGTWAAAGITDEELKRSFNI
jgi:hypothetical protein